MLLQFLQIFVLSRLLGSEAYGLIAIVNVFIGLTGIICDMGVTSIYIQKRNLTRKESSALFSVVNITTIVFFLFFVIFGGFIADYYNDKRIYVLLLVSCIVLQLNNISLESRLTHEKDFNFKRVSIVEVTASATALLTSIFAAIYGQGVYSIVEGMLVGSLTTVALYYNAKMPYHLNFSFPRLHELIKYKSNILHLLSGNIINQFLLSIDLLIGGRYLPPDVLGYYSAPRNVLLQLYFIANPIVTRVSTPLISYNQTNVNYIREIYEKILTTISAINLYVYIFLAFHSKEMINIIFGAKWDSAVEPFSVLCIWAALRSIYNPIGGLLVGMNMNAHIFWWNFGQLIIAAPVLYFSIDYGAIGLSCGMLLIMIILYYPMWKALVRPACGIGFLNFSKRIFVPFINAIIAVSLFSQIYNVNISPYVSVFIEFLLSTVVYIILSWVNNKEFVKITYSIIKHRNA